MRSESAIVRVGRILDLLPLLSKREMSLEDLAKLYGIDAATLRHDLELAFLCGLPGYTPDLLIDVHFGEEFVSVKDAQGLEAPRRITDEELALLLIGLDALEVVLAQSPGAQTSISSLRKKLATSNKNLISALHDETSENWQIIEVAVAQGREIIFDYVDTLGKQTSARRVIPLRIRLKRDRAVLEGFDLGKEARRIFYISSISNCRIGELAVAEIPDLDEDLDTIQVCTVTMRAIPRWWMRRHGPFILRAEEREGAVQVELEYWSIDWLLRALLPLTDQLIRFADPAMPESVLRQSLLSHFSGSEGPIDA